MNKRTRKEEEDKEGEIEKGVGVENDGHGLERGEGRREERG